MIQFNSLIKFENIAEFFRIYEYQRKNGEQNGPKLKRQI